MAVLFQLIKRFWFPVLIVTVSIYVAYYGANYMNLRSQVKLTKEDIHNLKRKMLQQPLRFHGEVCSESSNTCFFVNDYVVIKEDDTVVIRAMEIKDSNGIAFSITYLRPPDGEPSMEEFLNTRKWPADKRIIYSSYAKVMVGMLFVMEGLSFTSTQWQDVLMIGLGGGVINNFFGILDEAKINLTTVEIDPDMPKLAKDYFDLEESSTNTIIIADGISFIHEASKNGQKYKSMIVDACYTSCPAEGFWQLDTAKHIADIVGEEGTLSVNILGDDEKREQLGQLILPIYRKYFSTCFIFEALSQQIMLCSHREDWSLQKQNERFLDKMAELDQRFQFDLRSLYPKQFHS